MSEHTQSRKNKSGKLYASTTTTNIIQGIKKKLILYLLQDLAFTLEKLKSIKVFSNKLVAASINAKCKKNINLY